MRRRGRLGHAQLEIGTGASGPSSAGVKIGKPLQQGMRGSRYAGGTADFASFDSTEAKDPCINCVGRAGWQASVGRYPLDVRLSLRVSPSDRFCQRFIGCSR